MKYECHTSSKTPSVCSENNGMCYDNIKETVVPAEGDILCEEEETLMDSFL